MSPDRLGTALHDLVDDVEDGLATPVADELWSGGRRRRRTARLIPVVAAACVAALVTVALWPAGAPRASVPAVTFDDDGYGRLKAYPSAIPKPPFVPSTARPGVTAAVVAQEGDTLSLYAVSPEGVPRRLLVPDVQGSIRPAVSPDGRWLSQGGVLSDLVGGATVPAESVRAELESTRAPMSGSAWWSPDSRRVYVDGINEGTPRSSGYVVGTDGTVTEAPLLDGGAVPRVAGWMDRDTVLAFVVGFADGEAILSGRTWRVGDPSWKESIVDVQWPNDGSLDDSEMASVRADLSPDGTLLLLTRKITDTGTGVLEATQGALFDGQTGRPLGIPDAAGRFGPVPEATGPYLEWGGWGCRPAWRNGLPVTTDDRIRRAVIALGDDLVSVSGRYGAACVAFAGNELRGAPEVDSVAVWQERLWVWGGRLLVLLGIGTLVWWFTRRRSWNEGAGPGPAPYFLPSRG